MADHQQTTGAPASRDHRDHDVYMHATPGIGIGVTCRTCNIDLCWDKFDLTLKQVLDYVGGTQAPMV